MIESNTDINSTHMEFKGDKKQETVWIVASKKNHRAFTFINNNSNSVVAFWKSRNGSPEKDIPVFLQELRDKSLKDGSLLVLVSFGYTFEGLEGNTKEENQLGISLEGFKKVLLKDYFVEVTGYKRDQDTKLSRMDMAKYLEINPNTYEPNCPKATPEETCRLYQAIYEKLSTYKN
uniref:Uncharacterized protein n=1 Tax=viral metagenome TaxID=1070528 RepID=A0A6C0E7W0_9ZZZZ